MPFTVAGVLAGVEQVYLFEKIPADPSIISKSVFCLLLFSMVLVEINLVLTTMRVKTMLGLNTTKKFK